MPTISVPQQSGDITLTKPGDAPIVYLVNKGQVTVPDDEVGDFVTSVPGASIVGIVTKGAASE